MKKFFALLLTVAMLVGIMPVMSVSAADTSDETADVTSVGWSYSDWGSSQGYTLVGASHKISPSVTYQGTGAMHLTLTGDGLDTTNDRYVVRNTNESYFPEYGSTYKLSFYIKINKNEVINATTGQTAAIVQIGGKSFYLGTNSPNIAADDDGDGWQKFEAEIEMAASQDQKLGFWLSASEADIYIDNIVLAKVTDGVVGANILPEKMANFDNNSFEYAPTTGETVSANTLGWQISDWSSVSKARKKHHHVSTNESYEGSGSLHVQYWTDGLGGTDGNDRFAIRSDNHYLDGSSAYKLTMYIKIIGNSLMTSDTTGTNYTMHVIPGGDAGTIYISDSVLTDTEKEGWKKLEKTFKSTATTDRLQIYFGQGNADVYIDSISLCKDNGDGTYGENIFADKGEMMYNFDEDTGAAVFAPDTSDENTDNDAWDFGWVWSDWSTTTNAKKMSYSISPSVSHKGSGSLHMVYEDDGDSTTDDKYAVRQQNKLTVGNKYKASLYVKINFIEQQDNGTNESAYINAGGDRNVLLTDTANYVDGPDENGWQKIEFEFTAKHASGTTASFDIYAQRGRVDIYIDTVSIIDITNNNTEILDTVEKRSFDTDGETTSGGGDDPVVPTDPWTDADVTPVMPSNVTDFTGVAASDYGWEVSNFEGANTTIEVSSATAYEGKNSLHVKFSKTGTKDYSLIRPVSNDANNLTAGKTYKVTMYIRPVVNTEDGIGAKFISHSTAATLGNTKGKITKADKPGWYKYEDEGAVELTRLHIMTEKGICDFYVDNVSVCLVDDDGTVGENRFADKRGTFEAEGATGYTVSGPKLYDADGNNVTDITEAVSGKTITAAVAVANYTEAETFTAEVIVCLYKGNVLLDTVMSGAQNIKTTDSAKFITKDIVLPEISAEAADEYTLRVFTWESIGAMAPLSLSTPF